MPEQLKNFLDDRNNTKLIGPKLPLLTKIDAYEQRLRTVPDEQLAYTTNQLKQKYASNESNIFDQRNSTDLVIALAIGREATRRATGKTPYPTQLLASLLMGDDHFVEMQTGQGKSLVGPLAAYLHVINGKNIHVITSNDYLAKRDAQDNAKTMDLLGISIGFASKEQDRKEQQVAFQNEITYATIETIGFADLRDNSIATLPEELVFQPNTFKNTVAIVDEVDSILLDQATTPLIISGSDQEAVDQELFEKINQAMEEFSFFEMEIDGTLKQREQEQYYDVLYLERTKELIITEKGIRRLENLFHIRANSTNPVDYEKWMQHYEIACNAALARFLKKGVDYIVWEDKIMLINRTTDRKMQGTSFSDGLQQAIQAKEGLEIEPLRDTIAMTTINSIMNKYSFITGMSGTLQTDAQELHDYYKKSIVMVPKFHQLKPDQQGRYTLPTTYENQRTDYKTLITKDKNMKYDTIVALVKQKHAVGQPILIGTSNIKESQELYKRFQQEGLVPQLLNAEAEEEEAEIVANAGRKSAITIATNMAGRGTDMPLGGDASAYQKKVIRNLLSTTTLLSDYLASPYVLDEIKQMQIETSKKQENNNTYEAFQTNVFHILAKIFNQPAPVIMQILQQPNCFLPLKKKYEQMMVNAPVEQTQLIDESLKELLQTKTQLFVSFLKQPECPKQMKDAYELQMKHAPSAIEKQELIDKQLGLFVIGTEYQMNNRIDNQLKGRTARQQDPGATCWVVSWEDQILDIAPSLERQVKHYQQQNQGPVVDSKQEQVFLQAQKVAAGITRDSREHQVKFDIILDNIRNQFYQERQKIMSNQEQILQVVDTFIDRAINGFPNLQAFEQQYAPYLGSDWEEQIVAFQAGSSNQTFEQIKTMTKQALIEKISINCNNDKENITERLIIQLSELWKGILKEIPLLQKEAMILGNTGKDPYGEYIILLNRKFQELQSYYQQSFLDDFLSKEAVATNQSTYS